MAGGAMSTTDGHRPVLIEDWLPIRELGIESVRERQVVSALPPLSFLHVWWARRPLAAAQGVQLAAVLPPWSDDLLERIDGLPDALERVKEQRQDVVHARRLTMSHEDWYRIWVLWVAGVRGDTVAVMRAAELAGAKPSFTWPQAYRNRPSLDDLAVIHALLIDRWGRIPRVLDPTAGGGSLPFVAQRYGLPAWANDLNPVAAGVLEAGLSIPATFGPDLTEDLKHWGGILCERLEARLAPFFPLPEGESVQAYLWVNTVNCPRTGGPVPLAPNWWLEKGEPGVAVRVHAVRDFDGRPSRLDFEIVENVKASEYDPDVGTVARGDAVSPWDGLVVEGSHIKSEAQAGRMYALMYAVSCKRPKATGRGQIRYYRVPTCIDRDAVLAAAEELARLEASDWARSDVLPDEPVVPLNKTLEITRYGRRLWRDLFTPRQLLAHGSFVEEWRRLVPEVIAAAGKERGTSILTLLGMMQSRALNYNARLSAWHPSRQSMANVFDRHDFAFKWTHGEFDSAHALFQWCMQQASDAYEKIANLIVPEPSSHATTQELLSPTPSAATILNGNASQLSEVAESSIECVAWDPPYFDNVMYAELADFFYVWEKRVLGVLRPDRFADHLTNKDDEAVANVARFADAGKRKAELAAFDYEQKMRASFEEAHRVLTDDGVMTIWFTHKRAEAWDTLAAGLIEAGFTIEASWPVNTESATSLHIAGKNAAASTIILVCRKRRDSGAGGVFFEDIEAELRHAAREAVERFGEDVGIGGVDLQLATYGPTLAVLARHWPVLSMEQDETGRSRKLRPEEALAVARQEVARLRMARLIGKDASFDAATDFWLLCWETFQAREFPYDEARRLALGVGFDVELAAKAGLVRKKAGSVELIEPGTRGRELRGRLDDTGRFDQLVDALHHLLVLHSVDGLAAARTWLADSGYGDEGAFLDLVQGAVRAVPRVRGKKGYLAVEAQLLEDAVVALFGDRVQLPAATAEHVAAEQQAMELES